MNLLLSGNRQRFAEYDVWTWFPFGRAPHDVYKTVENPVMILERMIGLPVHAFERQIVTERKRRRRENVFLNAF